MAGGLYDAGNAELLDLGGDRGNRPHSDRMESAMTRYTLRRAGQFAVTTVGSYHCGTTPELDVKYTLLAVCPVSGLDRRGFLFDQVAVQKWFEQIGITALSCELLAQWCARELYKLIRRDNRGLAPLSISLALSPAPYAAEITYEWDGQGVTPDAVAIGAEPRRVTSRVAQFRPDQSGLGLEYGGLFS